MHVDFALLAAMFAVAAIAGAFDAIAGGGGLLTVPALLLTGMNPVAALGTNKLQGAFGALSSTTAFARRGLIDWKTALPVAGAAAVAGLCGALCRQPAVAARPGGPGPDPAGGHRPSISAFRRG